jgi:CHAD domain-containing protein
MSAVDTSLQLLAADYVRKQLRKLRGELAGVRDPDTTERVHQARVGSRRLRVALRMFEDCFGAKRVKKWRRAIKRLLKALGPARDKDVQIEFVRGVLSGLEEKKYRPGIARLLLRLRQDREAMQPKVVDAADRLEKDGTLAEVAAAIREMAPNRPTGIRDYQSPLVFHRSRTIVLERLSKLLELQGCLKNPEDRERHHDMRIATKRLRYSTEICRRAYGDRLDPYIRAVKDLQEILGNLHDCDVWEDDLTAFLQDERERTVLYYGHGRPFARLRPGLEYLLQERRMSRELLFRELCDEWARFGREELWERLVGTLLEFDRAPEPSREAEPSNGPDPARPWSESTSAPYETPPGGTAGP